MKRPGTESWQGYWTTKIGWAESGTILVRGYRAEALIRATGIDFRIGGELAGMSRGERRHIASVGRRKIRHHPLIKRED